MLCNDCCGELNVPVWLIIVWSAGIYVTMRCLLRPGDVVLTTFPAYQSLYEVAHSLGCSVSHWEPKPSAPAAEAGDNLGRLAFDVAELCAVCGAGLGISADKLLRNFLVYAAVCAVVLLGCPICLSSAF